ncbi:uncharacterized protein [Eucyclogobius newberryi]|uniref:uncharacterized protein isoform X1 n=1 Tax=Eucyclogobius newberryi TaxID=166745 RepID=UPI003B5B2567
MEPTTWGVQIPSRSHGLGLKQEIPEMPRIKEEPMEPCVKQEEDQLEVSESSLLQQHTEHREETQRKDIKRKDSEHSFSPGLKQEIPETPQIKEEPIEQRVKQEDDQLEVSVPDSSDFSLKMEESSVLQQRHLEHKEQTQGEDISSEPHFHSETEGDTEHSSDTDNAENVRAPFSFSDAQMTTEADGDHYNLIQNGARSTSAQNSGADLYLRDRSETSEAANNGDVSGRTKGTQRKKHQCSFCAKRFGSKQGLQRHIRVHTGDKPYSCPVCNKGFSFKSHLTVHLRTHRGEKPFSCLICKKTFTQKIHLSVHMRTHTGEKLFSCPICKKDLTHSTSLQYHMRTHTGEKPYSCSICKKTFTQNSNLAVHQRTHTGKTSYSCSICNTLFTSSSYLKIHMRKHTGEKPYSCSICNLQFTSNCNLKSHMKSHTGEKPYSCSICNTRFSFSFNLKSHMRRHTGEKL